MPLRWRRADDQPQRLLDDEFRLRRGMRTAGVTSEIEIPRTPAHRRCTRSRLTVDATRRPTPKNCGSSPCGNGRGAFEEERALIPSEDRAGEQVDVDRRVSGRDVRRAPAAPRRSETW